MTEWARCSRDNQLGFGVIENEQVVSYKGDMFNLDFTFKVVLTSMALVNLSAIIPATPGMFGTYHLAVVTAMSIWGFSKVDCNGYAIFAHGTNYLSMIFHYLVCMLKKCYLYQTVKNQSYF